MNRKKTNRPNANKQNIVLLGFGGSRRSLRNAARAMLAKHLRNNYIRIGDSDNIT
ncbi:MAG: hypothetical protein LBQ66_15480 [Planctomycetaceae bacterium]|nr:hypothetical protein [Planctomycetaceae bacterium]